MGIIATLVSGLVIGIIAKMFVHGPGEPQGFILTIILGIVGAFVGQYIGGLLNIGGGDLMWWVMSVIGAIIVLVIWGAVARRTA